MTLNGVTQSAVISRADGSFAASFAAAGLGAAGSPYAIAYSYAGDSNWWATSGQGTLTVAKADQTITFASLPDRMEGDPPFTVSAAASSGLPVSLSVVSGRATLTGNTVTLEEAGTVVLQASQAGDANYNPAPAVSRSFVVAEGPAGRMQGEGFVKNGRRQHHFEFVVWQTRKGREGGEIEYRLTAGRPGKDGDDDDRADENRKDWEDRDRRDWDERRDRDERKDREDQFHSTAITVVIFSEGPSSRPGKHHEPRGRTVVFSGVGRWKGHAGYRFEARATDGGEHGHGDTFGVTVHAPDGRIVATVTGPLSGGDIQTLRVWR
jgi:hypothetical protein